MTEKNALPIFEVNSEEHYRKEVMKFHILYLEKLEKLKDGERAAYVKYLDYLSAPIISGRPGMLPLQSFEQKMEPSKRP